MGLWVCVRFYIHNLHTPSILYLGLICQFAGLGFLFAGFLIWIFTLFKLHPPKVLESLLYLFPPIIHCRSSQFVCRLIVISQSKNLTSISTSNGGILEKKFDDGQLVAFARFGPALDAQWRSRYVNGVGCHTGCGLAASTGRGDVDFGWRGIGTFGVSSTP